jgi:hypothetical protein
MSEIGGKIPVAEIKPGNPWINLDLRELWAYRELVYFLTQREVKIRYKQTAIGVFWAILQPVLTTAIFTAIFSQFARFDAINVPYPLFALSGLLIWLYINTAVANSSASLTSNTSLVTKVYLPRVIIPLSVVLSGLIDLLIGLVILAGLLAWYGIAPTWQIILAPVFIVMAFLLALGCGAQRTFSRCKTRAAFCTAGLDVSLAGFLPAGNFDGKMAICAVVQSAVRNFTGVSRFGAGRRFRLARDRDRGGNDTCTADIFIICFQENGRRFCGCDLDAGYQNRKFIQALLSGRVAET